MGLVVAHYVGLYGLLHGLTKSADHPSRPAQGIVCVVLHFGAPACKVFKRLTFSTTLMQQHMSLCTRPQKCIGKHTATAEHLKLFCVGVGMRPQPVWAV